MIITGLDWINELIDNLIIYRLQTKVKLVPRSEYPYKAQKRLCKLFSRSHGGIDVKNFTALDFR